MKPNKHTYNKIKVPAAILICLTLFTSCMGIEKTIKESYRYEMYIDYEYVSFQGQNTTQKIYLEIDSTNRFKYVGKLILNELDTIILNGFEKGGYYPSWYIRKETGEKGMLEIWCQVKRGQIPNSIEITERDLDKGIIKEKTILYRQPRKNCR